MGRKKNPVPSYLLHKTSGQARVVIDGKDIYLGRHGSPESIAEYRRLIAELAARPGVPAAVVARPAGLTVAELLLAYWRHAEQHYRHPDGRPTSEIDALRRALAPVRELYAHTPAAEFDGVALKAVRQRLVEAGHCRTRVNAQVNRVRRVWRWAVGESLVPPTVLVALKAVEPLKRGRTPARETDPVRPVADEVIEATLPRCAPAVAAMVRLQRLTGMRPGEVVALSPEDIDRTGAVWVARPGAHKTSYAGRVRTIRFGPRAQAVLAPWLEACPPGEYLFSPRRLRAERYAALRAARKTKVQPSQVTRAKPNPRRQPGDRFTTKSYAAAVAKAAKAAGLGSWGPNRLRHTRATEIRAIYGAEAARTVLDHASLSTTELYAERDAALAERVAAEIG